MIYWVNKKKTVTLEAKKSSKHEPKTKETASLQNLTQSTHEYSVNYILLHLFLWNKTYKMQKWFPARMTNHGWVKIYSVHDWDAIHTARQETPKTRLTGYTQE